MKIRAIEHAQALADVAEADTLDVDVGHFLFRDTHAVVLDFDVQPSVAVCCAKLNFAAVELWSESVFQAILDDGLQKHARNEGFKRFFIDVFDDVQIIAPEPGHLDVEIVVDKLELLAQRNECFVLTQQPPQNIAELEYHAARVVGIEADERGNRVEGVEKEVRVDLPGKRVHARFQEKLLVPLEVHLDARVVPDFKRRGNGHERGNHRQYQPPVPLRMNREKPFRLRGVHKG